MYTQIAPQRDREKNNYNVYYITHICIYLHIILHVMKKRVILLPKQKRILKTLGENIKFARLRRKLSTEQVSERANISRKTLYEIENGSATVSIGSYLQVLLILGLENDLALVAKDDELGRKIQDSDLIVKKRAPKKAKKKD